MDHPLGAQERAIEPEEFAAWFEREELLKPETVFPQLLGKLAALIGEDWLFDPSSLL